MFWYIVLFTARVCGVIAFVDMQDTTTMTRTIGYVWCRSLSHVVCFIGINHFVLPPALFCNLPISPPLCVYPPLPPPHLSGITGRTRKTSNDIFRLTCCGAEPVAVNTSKQRKPDAVLIHSRNLDDRVGSGIPIEAARSFVKTRHTEEIANKQQRVNRWGSSRLPTKGGFQLFARRAQLPYYVVLQTPGL